MKRTALTKQAPHPWPFSHGIVLEGPARIVFLAGQVAFDRHGPDRRLVGVGDPAVPGAPGDREHPHPPSAGWR